MKFVSMALAVNLTLLAYADDGTSAEEAKPSKVVSEAEKMLRSPKYKCKPYLHFMKPGDLYKYFTLTVCIEAKGTSVTYLLTNNCADTVYWTGLGPRTYNGEYSTATRYDPNKNGSYLETIDFRNSSSPLSTKINPGETVLPPSSQTDRIHNDPAKVLGGALTHKEVPYYLPIESWNLSSPYASIAMTFRGDEIKFSEVFVAVLAQN